MPSDLIARLAAATEPSRELCSDCPPRDYPTDKTRCAECPRRIAALRARGVG